MITITGHLKGVKTVPSKNPDQYPDRHFLGLATEKVGGFPGEEDIIQVRLTKDQVQKGWVKTFQDASPGKLLTVPVFITSRVWNNNAFVDYYLSGKPLEKPIQIANAA